MEKPPDGTFTILNEVLVYWHALQAEGQGMVMAFAISVLRVIYDGKKFNRRRDTAEVIGAPLAAYATCKAMFAMGVSTDMAIPIGYAVASVGTIWIRNTMTDWIKRKFPKD